MVYIEKIREQLLSNAPRVSIPQFGGDFGVTAMQPTYIYGGGISRDLRYVEPPGCKVDSVIGDILTP